MNKENLPHLQIPEMKPIRILSVQLIIELGHTIIHVCLEALAIEIRVILRQLGNRLLVFHRNLLDQTGKVRNDVENCYPKC